MKADGRDQIQIHVPEKEINYAIGYKSGNRKMLEQRYRSVKFRKSAGMVGRDLRFSKA